MASCASVRLQQFLNLFAQQRLVAELLRLLEDLAQALHVALRRGALRTDLGVQRGQARRKLVRIGRTVGG
jgi:hypothetical protein